MTQQVNLFQPMFRRERRLLTAKTLAQASGLVACALLGIFAYASWQVSGLAHEVDRLQGQRQMALERLSTLQAELPRREQSKQLLAEIERLSRSLDARDTLVHTLNDRLRSPQSGLSQYLAGLARQTLEGLWLTSVRIDEGGQRIVLRGRTLKPELVPAFVRKLAGEDSFTGLKFRELNIDRVELDAEFIEFELSTHIQSKAS